MYVSASARARACQCVCLGVCMCVCVCVCVCLKQIRNERVGYVHIFYVSFNLVAVRINVFKCIHVGNLHVE